MLVLLFPFPVIEDTPCQGPVPELVRIQDNGLDSIQHVMEVSNCEVI